MKYKYVAATGLNYVSRVTGQEVRVEKGEEVREMNDVSLRHELEAGHVVEVEEESGSGTR